MTVHFSQRSRLFGAALASVTLFATVAAPHTVQAAPLAGELKLVKQLNAIVDPAEATSGSNLSVVVLDAPTGRWVYAHNAVHALAPASSIKNLTAMAALNYLGPAYTFPTDTYVPAAPVGGVVSGAWIKGYGDPTLMQADLGAIADQYKAKGITKINGPISIDSSYFDAQRYNPYWSTSYASDYYAGQIDPVTLSPTTDFNAGTFVIHAAPSSTAGAPAVLTTTPAAAIKYVKLVNHMTTGTSGSSSWLSATRTLGTNTVTVSGRVAVGHTPLANVTTVHEPGLYVGTIFKAELAKRGITVTGVVQRARVPAGAVKLTTHQSRPLSEILVPYLKLSNNMISEALTKHLAAKLTGRPGNWADGTALVINNAKAMGVNTSGIRLVDGSGLARANRVTAVTFAGALYAAQRAAWFPTFKKALPVAGTQPVRWVGGTLANRMVGTSAAGRVNAKNGYLTGVSSLNGYATNGAGRTFIFVVIGNYTGTSTRPVEEKLCIALASFR